MFRSRTTQATLALLACAFALTAAAALAATPKVGSAWTGPTSQGTQSSVKFKVIRRGRHGRSVARFKAAAAALSCNYGGGTANVTLPGRVKVSKGGRFKRTRFFHLTNGSRVTFKVIGRFRTRHRAGGILRIRSKSATAECYTDTVSWTARTGG